MHDVETTSDSREVTINGRKFAIANRYAAGHVLSEAEANAFNSTLADAVRNGFFARMKKMIEARTPDSEIEAALADYAASYVFGARRIYNKTGNAEEAAINRIALQIAKECVRQKLVEKGISSRKLGDVKITEYANTLLERNGKIREEALRRYQETTAVELDDDDFITE